MAYSGKYLNPDAKASKKAKQKPSPEKKKGKGKKVALIVSLLLVVLLSAAAVGGIMLYNSLINKVNRAEVVDKDYTMNDELQQMMGVMEETEETTLPSIAETVPVEETIPAETAPAPTVDSNKKPDILNVLVVGQSAREGEEYRMADTMILVTINKDTKVVTLTSCLRDTFVKLPDYKGHVCGKNRINVCYHLGWTWGDTGGAMEMTNLCLKNNFGIEVDHNVEVDFNAFKQVIEILGGIRIELTEAEAKYLNDEPTNWQEVEAGENRLYGDAALAYARMRKAEGDSDSDIKRTERQRKLLTAIFNKLKSKGMSGVQDIANEILPMISTNMTNAQITSAMLDLLPLLKDLNIETGTCPVSGSYKGEVLELSGVPSSVIRFDSTTNKRQMMMLTEGITEEEAAKIY